MASAQVEDSWVVVDKTTSGTLRAKGSQESLFLSDDEGEAVRARVHVQASKLAHQTPAGEEPSEESGGALAPELLEWINNAANESSTGLPLANRNTSVSKCSYRTNSSSAGSRQRRTHRRSSVHATSEVSSLLGGGGSGAQTDALAVPDGVDLFNEGMFVVKVVEVKQVGATKPMNIQCVAQVGDERFVIPPVATQPKGYNTWAAKMNDTFVFDVSRQFTFNLGVYGTHPSPPKPKATSALASRVSLVSRRHGSMARNSMARNSMARNSVALSNDSNPSLLSNSSSRTSTKIKRGLRKIFRNKNGLDSPADDPAYTGYSVPSTPVATESSGALGRAGAALAGNDSSSVLFDSDQIQTAQATDETGRSIEVQRHSVALGSDYDVGAMGMPVGMPMEGRMMENPLHQHPAFSRLSSYLPRSRTNTTTSAHEINYNGPRLRAFSNASTISSTPQPVGELFLDYRVDRREKRRATFTLPVVNQEQVVMRGGSHVEMAVVLEYGIIVNETWQERAARAQREREREQVDQQHERRQRLERQWAEVDEQDKAPRLRSHVSVFTRSGRVSTWKRYWAVLSCARILFYDSEDDEERGTQPVAKISLFHLHDAGVPKSDLVNIGPTGLELHLSPLAMTDRHRRKSAFPRESAANGAQAMAAAAARDIHTHPLPGMERLSIATADAAPNDDDDSATLAKYSQWQCRVYLLLDTLGDRDLWLQELTLTTVPSAEFMRFRARQRRAWRAEEFESATQSLRLSGKTLQVVAAQARGMSAAHTEQAKLAFVASVGGHQQQQRSDSNEELEGATLTSTRASAFGKAKIVAVAEARKNAYAKPGKIELITTDERSKVDMHKPTKIEIVATTDENRKPAMAFGKPATFSLLVAPAANADPHATLVSSPIAAPAKKRLRARRRSSSVADLRRTMAAASSSDESQPAPSRLARRDSGDSTVIEVVGTAKERRPGTVSRRFLFVWNVSDI